MRTGLRAIYGTLKLHWGYAKVGPKDKTSMYEHLIQRAPRRTPASVVGWAPKGDLRNLTQQWLTEAPTLTLLADPNKQSTEGFDSRLFAVKSPLTLKRKRTALKGYRLGAVTAPEQPTDRGRLVRHTSSRGGWGAKSQAALAYLGQKPLRTLDKKNVRGLAGWCDAGTHLPLIAKGLFAGIEAAQTQELETETGGAVALFLASREGSVRRWYSGVEPTFCEFTERPPIGPNGPTQPPRAPLGIPEVAALLDAHYAWVAGVGLVSHPTWGAKPGMKQSLACRLYLG